MYPSADRRRLVILAGALGLVAAVALGAKPASAQPLRASPVAAPVKVRPSACDMPVVSVACEAVGDVVGSVERAPQMITNGAVDAFSGWIASGAASLVEAAGQVIFSSTSPSLVAGERPPWFLQRYRLVADLAVLLMAPMLILAALQAALTRSAGMLGRALVNLPVAALGMVAAVTVVQLLVGATDWACLYLARPLTGDTANFLSGVAHALLSPAMLAPGGGAVATFGVALVGLFMAVVSLVVWLELVVRDVAIYLTVLFLPLGFATSIWPALSPWLRRLIETIVALVLSKLVIVAALSLAGGALAEQHGFGVLVAGAGMLLLAAFAPFALFKLIPIASLGTIASLEGMSRRAPRAATPRLSTANQVRHLALAAGASPGGVGGMAAAGIRRPPPLPGGGSSALPSGSLLSGAGPASLVAAAGATSAAGNPPSRPGTAGASGPHPTPPPAVRRPPPPGQTSFDGLIPPDGGEHR